MTVDNPGTVAALELLKAMRWEDNSMGSNFLLDWGTINQAFAAGQVGMYMSGSDVYNSLVTENEIDPATYGLTILPLAGDDAGVLSGGSVAAIRADASDAEKEAGVKWIDFFYMQKLTNEERRSPTPRRWPPTTRRSARPSCRSSAPSSSAESDAWIADFVNVPLEQMTGFTDNILDQPIVPEPAAPTQEMYAILDSVVQAVLTDENADIAALLEEANAEVDGADRGELTTWDRSGAGRPAPDGPSRRRVSAR